MRNQPRPEKHADQRPTPTTCSMSTGARCVNNGTHLTNTEESAMSDVSVVLEQKYCPVCQRFIQPELTGNGGAIYIHDNIVHNDSDIKALELGVQ